VKTVVLSDWANSFMDRVRSSGSNNVPSHLETRGDFSAADRWEIEHGQWRLELFFPEFQLFVGGVALEPFLLPMRKVSVLDG